MRKLLVTFFGLGFGPVAPATWGSLGAAAVFLALYLSVGLPWWALLALVVLASVACVALGPWAQDTFGASDPKPVVIDEVAGMWLSLLFVPVGTGRHAVWVVAAAFVLFRIFDVLKPPPARQLERLRGGWGILADDLAAGVMTNLLLQLALLSLASPGLTVANAAALGLVQGLTEFLPVSSSGHLAIVQSMMKVPENLALPFDVLLHVATLLAVLLYFHRDVRALFRGAICVFRRLRPDTPDRENRRLFLYVFVASIPTAIIAFAIKEYVEQAFNNLIAVGVCLMITGVLLFFTRRFREAGRPFEKMRTSDALAIGVVQGIAALPGISRSGSTISTGLFLGLDGKLAARFSFLIFIPVMVGATLFEARRITTLAELSPWAVLAGAAVAFVSGLVAIAVVFRVLEKGRFAWFAPYCWLVGLIAIVRGLMIALGGPVVP